MFREFISSSLTIAEMEARKIRHDSTELWTRLVQPALWLLLFGTVFSAIKGITQFIGNFTYTQFITPGVLAQSVLFVAIFYGITVVWERDTGILSKLLSTPSPRSSIIVGKALSASVRGLFQAVMIFALALIIGVNLRFDPLDELGVLAVIVVFAMCVSSLSMILASFLKTRDRMMGIGQAITMPLFFASNAIYPISLMPSWLQFISKFNPLSYVVDAVRAMLLTGDYSNLLVDIAVLVAFTVLFLAIASVTIRRIIE
ncbi:MAG: ABC transporter permease [Nitrososphaeria archaeon]|jgi:ABC-2 type transport system permease protein